MAAVLTAPQTGFALLEAWALVVRVAMMPLLEWSSTVSRRIEGEGSFMRLTPTAQDRGFHLSVCLRPASRSLPSTHDGPSV